MGRRAAGRVDPRVDLTPWLRAVDDAPQPLNAMTCFGREAPLELEIGSGKGLFLSRAAAQFPERTFVGVEIAKNFARLAAFRLARRDANNALVLCGDALKLVREHVADSSLAAVHVYFPDPWWKKRHRKRRVMNAPFVRDIQRVLEPGGSLHFWTDVEEYFESTLELLARETSLVGPLAVEERPAESDLDYQTHFERRMRLHGEPVFRSRYVRQ